MADKKTVVVTGFGPWAQASPNPAAQVLELLSEQDWDHCNFMPFVVSVETAPLTDLVADLLRAHAPDIWLGLGVAPGAASLRVEIVGTNCRDFDVADNVGVVAEGDPVLEAGPPAYFSTLPVRDMADAMRKAGVPTVVSYSAGTHMCNQMLYTTLHLVAEHKLPVACGFVHVPHSPDFAARCTSLEDVQPSMELSRMATGVTVAIETALAHA